MKKHLQYHPLKGAFFETFVVSELLKNRYNKVLKSNLYYFRDNVGNEVDVIIENGNELIPLEIKTGSTVKEDFFKGIKFFQKINTQNIKKSIIVYGGKEEQKRTKCLVLPYNKLK